MSGTCINILNTPALVYQYAQHHFPKVKAKIVVTEDSLKLRLILAPDFPPLDLEHAVETSKFEKCLAELKFNKLITDTVKTESPLFLDSKRFSIAAKLSNWQGWYGIMRAAYESKNLKCIDVITGFLENSDNKKLLKLGLAPEQVENNPSELILKYFSEFMCNLKNKKTEENKSLWNNFKQQYPKTFLYICEKESQEKRSQNPLGKNFEEILKKLKEMVIGQDPAVEAVAGALSSQTRQDQHQVFLFVGPTGIGKTELAKSLATIKGNQLLIFNMEKYQEQHAATNFWGSSSGFVGSTSKPHFANAIDKYNPVKISEEGVTSTYEVQDIVFCFDEIEKTHSSIKQSFLSLFENGQCTFNYTKSGGLFGDEKNLSLKYIFKKCIMIGTSNLYHEHVFQAFNEGHHVKEIAELFKKLNRVVPNEKSFSPEFLGRLEVIPFGPIPRGEPYQKLLKIKLKICLDKLKSEFKLKSFDLEDQPLLFSLLEKVYYREGVDIRTVERNLNDIIKQSLVKKVRDAENLELILSCDHNDLVVKQSHFLEKYGISHAIDETIKISLSQATNHAKK